VDWEIQTRESGVGWREFVPPGKAAFARIAEEADPGEGAFTRGGGEKEQLPCREYERRDTCS
jgi:hypothetical protein